VRGAGDGGGVVEIAREVYAALFLKCFSGLGVDLVLDPEGGVLDALSLFLE
jgi:hypothetical protein